MLAAQEGDKEIVKYLAQHGMGECIYWSVQHAVTKTVIRLCAKVFTIMLYI